ncbi:hypothetical protein EYR36_001982 [Pleurotus pulmonarius]|nr:hypothetical protein EYR36_001982 [Pleurotus pulmonarius]KAF4588268.1 hypothetical protein EYR38_010235 [Pleurotus pulmonarius]
MNELYRSIDWREFDRNMAKTLICMHRNPALASRVRTLHIAAPMLEALYSVAQDSSEGTIKTFENIQSQYLAVDGLGKESTPETAGTQVEKRLRVGNEKPSDAREWMETALSNMVNIETCTFNSTQVPTAAEPAIRVLQKTLSQCVRKLVLDCGRASELQMLVSSSFQLRHLEDLEIILRFHPGTSSTQRHLDQKFVADRFAPFVNALHPTLVSLSVIATHGIDYSTFFDGIDVLPHLHQLFLWLEFDDLEISKPNSLIHFLRENSSQLTSVTLRSLPSSDSTWRKFASGLESDPQIFSGLRSLTIFRLPLDLKFVSSLIQRSKNTLKCLHVEQCPLELQQVRQLVSTLGETPVISLELEVNIFSPAVLDLLSKELPWLESLDITFDKVGSVHVDSRGEFVTTEFVSAELYR